jgi:flavin reductase (DIM6/NTAB) family NADH-FMN oxidoreductase RutF
MHSNGVEVEALDQPEPYPPGRPLPGSAPAPNGVLDGVLARLVCRVVARVPASGHRIVLAEAVVGGLVGHGQPLIHHGGGFTALSRRS